MLTEHRVRRGVLRSSVGRDFAVLTLLGSILAMVVEPTFNPLFGGGLALGYLLDSVLRPRAQPQRTHHYRRTFAGVIGGALGGVLVGAAVTMAVFLVTEDVVGGVGLTWNTFIIAMLLGGSLIGIKYIWQNSAPDVT